MSSIDEARTVDTLQRLAAAVPGAAWVPDEVAVRRRGHRIRARRWAGAVTAGAAVLALAVTVPAAVTGRLDIPPAGDAAVTQSPRPVGEGQVAVLTQDIQAVNVPAVTEQGALVVNQIADWNLTVRPSTGWHLWSTWQGVDVSWWWEGEYGSGGVTWRMDDDRPSSVTPDPDAIGNPSGDAYIVTGAVPADLRDPVALLSSAGGFDLGASGHVTTIELPTFRAPTDDGRLLYAVVLRGDAARRFDASEWQVTFVGSDGAVVIPGCGDPAACAIERLPYATLADAAVPRFVVPTAEPTAPTAEPTATPTDEPTATPTGVPSPGVADGTGPAPSTPAPPPATGIPPSATLAPGVLAAVGPIPGEGGLVAVGRFGDTIVRVGRDGSDSDAMVGLSVISAEGGMGAEPRTKEALGPWATVVYSAEAAFAGTPDERWFAFGTTPPDLAGARVFYYSPAGIAQTDGSRSDVIELPSFTMPDMANNPIEASRPWFLVGFSGDALASVRGAGGAFVGHVVFAGRDGSIEDPTCGFTECTGPDTAAAYDTIRHLMLAPPGVPTAS